MKVEYRGFEINVRREKSMGGDILRLYPPVLGCLADELARWWLARRSLERPSRITIGSKPEPFTIIDKTDSTIRVDRHDPNLKDGDIITPYEGRW